MLANSEPDPVSTAQWISER